mmetsp:Transcript_9787/g.35590  ORF Transcript_9787/g.35590 Transcript_9787/m.35590 type:complete len:154 (+) Transcript_9787:268-729(+)
MSTRSSSELTHQEVNFSAEDEVVLVVPNFSLQQVHLLGGTYGPFRPQIQAAVPLWFATILKKQGKCCIIPPMWLNVNALRTVIETERVDAVFQGLPFHYIELAAELCKHARDDMIDWSRLYDLVDTIRSVRHVKIQSGLRGLNADALKVIAEH